MSLLLSSDRQGIILTYLFNKYRLYIVYVPDTILNIGDTMMSKIGNDLKIMLILVERQIINKRITKQHKVVINSMG